MTKWISYLGNTQYDLIITEKASSHLLWIWCPFRGYSWLPPKWALEIDNLFAMDLGRLKSHPIVLLLGQQPPRLVREAFLGAAAALAFRSGLVCMTPIPFLDRAAFSFKSCCWHWKEVKWKCRTDLQITTALFPRTHEYQNKASAGEFTPSSSFSKDTGGSLSHLLLYPVPLSMPGGGR